MKVSSNLIDELSLLPRDKLIAINFVSGEWKQLEEFEKNMYVAEIARGAQGNEVHFMYPDEILALPVCSEAPSLTSLCRADKTVFSTDCNAWNIVETNMTVTWFWQYAYHSIHGSGYSFDYVSDIKKNGYSKKGVLVGFSENRGVYRWSSDNDFNLYVKGVTPAQLNDAITKFEYPVHNDCKSKLKSLTSGPEKAYDARMNLLDMFILHGFDRLHFIDNHVSRSVCLGDISVCDASTVAGFAFNSKYLRSQFQEMLEEVVSISISTVDVDGVECEIASCPVVHGHRYIVASDSSSNLEIADASFSVFKLRTCEKLASLPLGLEVVNTDYVHISGKQKGQEWDARKTYQTGNKGVAHAFGDVCVSAPSKSNVEPSIKRTTAFQRLKVWMSALFK